MNILNDFLEEVNNPKPESIDDNIISNTKKYISLEFFFISLWIILMTIGTIASIKGDSGTGFGTFLFSIGLGIVSEIVAIWLLFKEDIYKEKTANSEKTKRVLKKLKVTSILLLLSPVLYVLLAVLLSLIIPDHPFGGA